MTVCGLVTKDQKPVPLRSISINVSVQGFVADVVSELRYQNEEKTPVEAVFVFPLDDEAAVYAFEGLIGGKQIEAQIREKKQAQQEYEDALSEGHEAFLLGREERTSDIFTCSLGNLHPDEEAVLKLRYVQALAPEPDGAIRFVLPAVLNPRYVPHDSQGDTVTGSIPRVPKGRLPYTLSLSATLESPYGISRVESKCTLEPLQYKTEDQTIAQVSLAQGHQFDRDVELLIYYKDVHKPSAFLEAGKPGSATGSLMGDPVLLLTLFPSVPAPKPGQKAVGEFIFLMDRSGSMGCTTEHDPQSPTRIQSAKETLIFLLKSLPLGCYFNIYGFGSRHDSFYPQSVEYTQQTMLESLERVKELKADLGGTEILQPLKAIYSQPCKEGQPRQLFVFTDGEVFNTNKVISEVRRHSSSHRCFSFGIGEGASTALIKGIARAAGGSAEFITGKERMQAKALQSLKKALHPAVTGICLNWTLPASLEATLVGSGPQVIFQGQRCLIYAQITGQLQSAGSAEGTVVLQYVFQDQTFVETLKFPLHNQESDRFPVHRLAALTLLQELEGAVEEEEEKQRLALETSLSSGVVCSQTAYVGVNRESGKTVQGPLARRDIPLAGCNLKTSILQQRRARRCAPPASLGCYDRPCNSAMSGSRRALMGCAPSASLGKGHISVYQSEQISRRNRKKAAIGGSQNPGNLIADRALHSSSDGEDGCCMLDPPNLHMSASYSVSKLQAETSKPPTPEKEESPLLRLVFLQNADGSWSLDSALINIFGLSESEISSKMPAQATPSTWATVLAILWLHSKAMEQKEEWELLEAKAVGWLQANAGSHLAECVKTGNTILETSVGPNVFGL